MPKKSPPRPEDLDGYPNLHPKSGSVRTTKAESAPRNDWTGEGLGPIHGPEMRPIDAPWHAELGGYRDGRYYGADLGNRHLPANAERTYERKNIQTGLDETVPDLRCCTKCGTQRLFKFPASRQADDYCTGTDGKNLCNSCSGRSIRDAVQT